MPALYELNDGHVVRVHEILPGTTTIGRDGSNQIVLSSPLASRWHCRIAVDAGGSWIEDLGARNGTWVAERRIGLRRRLQSGAHLRLGLQSFVFWCPELNEETLHGAEAGDDIDVHLGSDHRCDHPLRGPSREFCGIKLWWRFAAYGISFGWRIRHA